MTRTIDRTQEPASDAPLRAAQPPPYAIRPSSVAGLGLFATRRIDVGERIVEYVGERISHAEAERRYDDEGMDVHHTFLFAVDEHWCIDGGVDGNDARYINHSCEPNCDAIDDGGRIFVEATRVIEAGEELLYDYSYEIDENLTERDAHRLYPCLCRAPSCRRTIAKLELPEGD